MKDILVVALGFSAMLLTGAADGGIPLQSFVDSGLAVGIVIWFLIRDQRRDKHIRARETDAFKRIRELEQRIADIQQQHIDMLTKSQREGDQDAPRS